MKRAPRADGKSACVKKPSVAINVAEKIIDRNKLQCDFEEYVKSYGKDLLADKKLQAAFIRKFDSLCEE